MNTAQTADRGWRGSRELWLEAGLSALVEGGVDAVRIQPLAARLKLSRTSFYWFFRDRAELLSALVEGWEARNTAGLTAAAEAYAATAAEAVLNVISCFLDGEAFDPLLEFAIRGWALQDAGVMARVNDADTRRLAVLAAMLERHGLPAAEADVRARTVYLTQIGYISMQVHEDLPTRLARVPHYVRIFSGSDATAGELARFRARHGA